MLWDSILHEIPIGTILLLKDGDEELVLDGQQRLNAILRGFGEYTQDNPDSVIWINFKKDNPFSVMVTTISHPWGYNDNEDCSKLKAFEQRNAIKEFLGEEVNEWSIYNNDAIALNSTWPKKAELPIPLQVLLQAAEIDSNHFVECVNNLYEKYYSNAYKRKVDREELKVALNSLKTCICNVLNYEIGATIMPLKSIETIEKLFNRINKGGTPINDDDLAYSTIKAYFQNIKKFDSRVSAYINPAKLARMAFRIIETETQNKNNGFVNHLSLDRIREKGSDKEYERRINAFYEKVSFLLKQVDDVFLSSKIPDVLKARIADQSTDLFMLLLYITYKQSNQTVKSAISSDFLCGLVFYIHWFSRDISRCVNLCQQYISDKGLNPDAIRLALAHAVNISILTPLITPDSFDNIMKIEADDKWSPHLSQWNELWECVHTNKEMLLYFQRNYLNECFRNYKPLNLKMWSEHNTPWDYDHIIPQNWFGNYNENHRYARFCRNYWLNNIGNLAAIPFETNRSKSDNDDWDYYTKHYKSLMVDISSVKELSKDPDSITSNQKVALSFAELTFNRCREIYKDCFNTLFQTLSFEERDLTQLAYERRLIFEKLNDMLRLSGEKSNCYYVSQDASIELPVENSWAWNMPWMSCGIVVRNDYYVALTCYLDYDAKPDPKLFFEIGIRRNPETNEIKRELPSFDEYTQYNKDWWYIERDINNEKEKIIIEDINKEIMELKAFVETVIDC